MYEQYLQFCTVFTYYIQLSILSTDGIYVNNIVQYCITKSTLLYVRTVQYLHHVNLLSHGYFDTILTSQYHNTILLQRMHYSH